MRRKLVLAAAAVSVVLFAVAGSPPARADEPKPKLSPQPGKDPSRSLRMPESLRARHERESSTVGHPGAGALGLAVLFRQLLQPAPASVPHTGPAGLFRCAHLRADRPSWDLSHRLDVTETEVVEGNRGFAPYRGGLNRA